MRSVSGPLIGRWTQRLAQKFGIGGAEVWNRGAEVWNRVAQKFGIGAQKFGIGCLIFENFHQVFANISATFQLRAMRPSANNQNTKGLKGMVHLTQDMASDDDFGPPE